MQFEFASANRIIFGQGRVSETGRLAAQFGERALVVTGISKERALPVLRMLDENKIFAVVFPVSGEPSVDIIRQAVKLAREESCQFLIGFGGGSVIDTAKAAAAILTNPGEVLDYLEVIGAGKPLLQPSAPVIAIPTTAGTGSEVTRNAVVGSPEQRVKVSMRSLSMLPKIALVDPELTIDLPPEITASTGLDALTQLIEPYVSSKANGFTDMFCRDGIKAAAHSLRLAYENGENIQARTGMSYASLLGGLALANAGLGAVHGFAGPLGGMYPAPHGAICARLLPVVMETNLKALLSRDPQNPAVERYGEIAVLLTGDPQAKSQDGIQWVHQLVKDLHIQPLSDYGITDGDIPGIVEKAALASSMKANPIELTRRELEQVIEQSIY